MVAGTALRERGFAEAKRLCYAGLDAPTLLLAVAGRLQRVVPLVWERGEIRPNCSKEKEA